MTSAIAPRRFTRLDVQTALQAVNCPDFVAYQILEALGALNAVPGLGFGQNVSRALGVIHQHNRPDFASPNTYAGMAWDRAHHETCAHLHVAVDLTQVWHVLDQRYDYAGTIQGGNEARGYRHYVMLARALVELEYGARPAQQQQAAPAPAAAFDLTSVLLSPEIHAQALEQVQEQDFPVLFQEALKTICRTWGMLSEGDRRFAAQQLAGFLRTIGVAGAAADQVETLGP